MLHSGITNNGNGDGPGPLNFRIRIGVFGQVRSRVYDSVVTGNGIAGVEGNKLRIERSTVTGNDAHSDCSTIICADLASDRPPVLVDSTCDRSMREDVGFHVGGTIPALGTWVDWDICSLD